MPSISGDLATYYDVSLVVQGAVSPVTKSVLDSLRKVFPGAELILSTWEGTDLSGLLFDKAVFSPDPGPQVADEVAHLENNVNRQLVTTTAGVKAATRRYILKTRTDIFINSTRFLNYFGCFDQATPYIFQNRVLICSYYTRNPRVMSICFHPSDWVLFGNAEDLKLYFSETAFQTDEEAEWFKTHEKAKLLFTNFLSRFTPEQYIFISFIRRFRNLPIDCYYDFDSTIMGLTEELYAKCFVVLDYQTQLDISFTKYDPNRYLEKHTTIAYWQWKALYQHYCQKRMGALWGIYIFYGIAWRCASRIRTLGIRILNGLGVKETMKHFLMQIRKP